ncbi:MAG: hypothetical protein ACREFY_09455 [Acetobacteraceae bacterium]
MSVIDLTSNTVYASLSAAITGSAANDVIALSAGSYVENFPDITHSLTIYSVGGLAQLTTPQPIPLNGRAILYVPPDLNVSLSVVGLEISGAVDPVTNNNGAGILFEIGNGNLTVSNSWFHNNQEGILVGAANAYSTAGTMVTINHSEFDNNGIAPGQPGSGFTHNLYVGAVAQLTVTNSYFHDAIGGHEIKSRAYVNVITNNRIQDQAGPASYSIDLANGGADIVSGNVIEKGSNAQNRYAVHFGGEGTYPDSSLTLTDNVFIGDRPGGTTALFNQSQDGSGANIPATVSGNTLYNIPLANLYQDNFGPPYDNVSNTIVASGAAPPLDTSHPFAVSEPASAWLLPVALLATAVLRRVRPRGRARVRSRNGSPARTSAWP